MNILLVGNFSADAQFSMNGYSDVLARGLRAHGISVTTLAPAPVLSRRFKNVNGGIGKWLGYVDKYLLFFPRLRSAARHADIIHVCDQGNGIYVSQLGRRKRLLLTCHDLFAVRAERGDASTWRLSATGRIYQKLIWTGIRNAANIVCVSEATRRDLDEQLRHETGLLERPNIFCILQGLFQPLTKLDDAVANSILKDQCRLDPQKPFLLHVGGNQVYKNRLGLLKVYAALLQSNPKSPPLVLAGKPLTSEMARFVADNNLSGKIEERSDLSDGALGALYSKATALIFPSTMEGFGLPVIEAQACGCPVFATSRSPMTEVGADAAVYIDPDDPVGAARIISATLGNEEKLREMTRLGYANVAARFSTDRMISEYRDLYDELVTAAKEMGKTQ